MFLSLSCVNNKEQPWPLTHRYKSTISAIPWYMSPFCPTCSSISAASKVFCIVDPFAGTVDIGGYLTCIGLSGQGKKKIMLSEAWTRRAAALGERLIEPAPQTAGYCVGRDVSVYSSVCLFVSRCSRKEACEKWAEPLHFSTELKQCVDITVTPDNMSVTSASTQVIEFYMLLQKHNITPV